MVGTQEIGKASSRTSVISRLRRTAGTALMLGLLAVGALISIQLVNGNWTASPVLSGSMRPGLAVGGLVIGERVPVRSLSVRDVILFQRPDRSSEQMVHRIIQIDRSKTGQLEIKTQGDANPTPDPWTVTISQPYVYRIRWAVPLVGYVVVAFQNHRGYVLLAAGVIALLIGGSFVLEKDRQKAAATEPATTRPRLRGRLMQIAAKGSSPK